MVDALQHRVPPGVAVSASVGAGCFAAPRAGSGRGRSARSAESRSARDCARAALALLGQHHADIPTGEGGRPVWPDGFVGSLSHCPGLRVAAVARADTARAVGIDVEPHRPIPPAVTATVTRGGEPSMLARLASSHPAVAWSTVVWSAKESIFKAWYPLTGRWVDPTACEVTVDPDRGSFEGRLVASVAAAHPDAPSVFDGRWLVVGAHLCTVVIVPCFLDATRTVRSGSRQG